MAKTVNIPGIGSVPTKYAVAGGLAVVGIAGFFWVRHLNSPPADDAAATGTTADYTGTSETIYPAYSADYAADESYDGGAYPYPSYTTPSYGITTTYQNPDPSTNPEWTRAAIEHLELVGYESGAASLAVSRYLLKECVTATQGDIVRQAVAAVGLPPQGTFNIITCPSGSPGDGTTPPSGGTPTPNPGTPPRPSGLRATGIFRNHVDIDWNPVNAPAGTNVGYTIWANGVRKTSQTYSTEHVWNLKPNTRYKIEVAAVYVDPTGPNSPDVHGPRAAITVRTKP